MGTNKENFYKYIDKYTEEKLQEIIENCCEFEQLESIIYLLDGLINWCSICLNDEQEEKDYKKLIKAYNILIGVHKNYDNNY